MSLFDLFKPKRLRIDLNYHGGPSVKMKNGQEMVIVLSPLVPLCVTFPDGIILAIMTEKFHNSCVNADHKIGVLKRLIEKSENVEDLIKNITDINKRGR